MIHENSRSHAVDIAMAYLNAVAQANLKMAKSSVAQARFGTDDPIVVKLRNEAIDAYMDEMTAKRAFEAQAVALAKIIAATSAGG